MKLSSEHSFAVFSFPRYVLAHMTAYRMGGYGFTTDFLRCFHKQSPDALQTRGRETLN